jgi:hypothetical protein
MRNEGQVLEESEYKKTMCDKCVTNVSLSPGHNGDTGKVCDTILAPKLTTTLLVRDKRVTKRRRR